MGAGLCSQAVATSEAQAQVPATSPPYPVRRVCPGISRPGEDRGHGLGLPWAVLPRSCCWPRPELPCRLEIQVASLPLPFFLSEMFSTRSVCHPAFFSRGQKLSLHTAEGLVPIQSWLWQILGLITWWASCWGPVWGVIGISIGSGSEEEPREGKGGGRGGVTYPGQAAEMVTPLWSSSIRRFRGGSAPDLVPEPWPPSAWPPSPDPTGGSSLELFSQPLWFTWLSSICPPWGTGSLPLSKSPLSPLQD